MNNSLTFTETQAFAPVAYGVLGLAAIGTVFSGFFWPPLLLGLTLNLLCLRTAVMEQEVTVSFGAVFPLYRRRIARKDIVSVEDVTYSPIAEYGGWGIKGSPANLALNARGNRGVRLHLNNGKRLLIGSQRPAELAASLQPTS